MDFSVREAAAPDRPACAGIYRSARVTEPWLNEQQRAAIDFERDEAGERVWVAVNEAGDVLGFASIWTEPELSFLHHLYVSPAQQRRGVGTALVDTVAQASAGPVELKALAEDHDVRRFYECLGFVEAERCDSERPPWVRYRLDRVVK